MNDVLAWPRVGDTAVRVREPFGASWRYCLWAACLFGAWLLVHHQFALVFSVGESMQPTFRSGTLLLLSRTAYRNLEPRRGDVVVAEYLGQLITKRVVGLPGETVEVREGVLLVNDTPVVEGHSTRPGTLRIFPGRLHGDRYALLGDNRETLNSVGVHAVVSRTQIVGKVIRSLQF